jgi:hypothetical protein
LEDRVPQDAAKARRPYRFTRPPRAIRHAQLAPYQNGTGLDNLALVPANLLPYKAQWQQLANDLPKGNILIILPDADQRVRKAVETVANLLKASGQKVTTLPANQFT